MSNSYYVIDGNNVCINTVLWDGKSEWSAPSGCVLLLAESTPVKVWEQTINGYVLQEAFGVGSIGFTWDGHALTTNLPKPEDPTLPPETKSIGVQTL